MRHVAPLSPLPSLDCAYFPSRRGVPVHPSRRQTFRTSGMPTLLLSKACRLFVVSLLSFPHSFPLFSIVCSLFSQNTRTWSTFRRSNLRRSDLPTGFAAALPEGFSETTN